MKCEHNKRIGDNYGLSCQDCGEQLEGYGHGGWFGSSLKGHEKCIHAWGNISADKEQCTYCFSERERENKAN